MMNDAAGQQRTGGRELTDEGGVTDWVSKRVR